MVSRITSHLSSGGEDAPHANKSLSHCVHEDEDSHSVEGQQTKNLTVLHMQRLLLVSSRPSSRQEFLIDEIVFFFFIRMVRAT